MTRYLAEVYAPAVDGLAEAVARAHAAAQAMSDGGTPIRQTHAIHVPQDETSFHAFEGPSVEAVRELARRAGLQFARIIEAVESDQLPTHAEGDDLARTAEQAFDLSTRHPRLARPSLDASSGSHSPLVSVLVPRPLHRRATARAAEEGRSVSDVVRELLEGYASGGPVEPAASARRR